MATPTIFPDLNLIVKGGKLHVHCSDPAVLYDIADQVLSYHTTRYGYLGNESKKVKLYQKGKNKDGTDKLIAPRGALYHVVKYAKKQGLQYEYSMTELIDNPLDLPVKFHGQIRDYQTDVIDAVGHKSSCLIKAPTGAGKTSMAIRIMAKLNQHTLVIVPGVDLILQWRQAIAQFLDCNIRDIGQIGGSKNIIKPITVGTHHSIVKNLKSLKKQFGLVIADECHSATARGQYEKCIFQLTPKHLIGLTATPVIDNSDRPLRILFGRQIKAKGIQELISEGKLNDYKVNVVPYSTEHYPEFENYSEALGILASDETRNKLIVDQAEESLNRDRGGYDGFTLVLCSRLDHIGNISDQLAARGIDYSIIHGAIDKDVRDKIYKDIRNQTGPRVLIGNQKIIGQGVDCPPLDTIILANPIASERVLQQAIGRIIRTDEGKIKPAVVVDISDDGIFSKGSRIRNDYYFVHNKVDTLTDQIIMRTI